MEEYRYSLDPSSHKDYCPDCGEKRFVRYIDNETENYLPEEYGRCDREDSCQYHVNPYKEGYHLRHDRKSNMNYRTALNAPMKQVHYPLEVLENTRSHYEKNVFIQNLLNNVSYPFEASDIEQVISMYHLGTIKDGYMQGSLTIPFINANGDIRAIQAKRFDGSNHTLHTNWVHSLIEKRHKRQRTPLPQWVIDYKKNQSKASCLFGEHLLPKYPDNVIALVEAPKTAIYGTLYFGFPNHSSNMLWLAVYSKSSLNYERCKELKGRKVILFPDTSNKGQAFKEWSEKAQELEGQLEGSSFIVSNLLEQFAPPEDKVKGYDLADYLILQDWQTYRRAV